jgi:hypothetical protein
MSTMITYQQMGKKGNPKPLRIERGRKIQGAV